MNSTQSVQQFTVVPRDSSMLPEETLNSVNHVIAQIAPATRLLKMNQHTGVAVIEVPDGQVGEVKSALDSAFMVDPNATLTY